DVFDLRIGGSRLQHDDHGFFVAGAFEAGSHRGGPEIGATRLRSPAPFRAVLSHGSVRPLGPWRSVVLENTKAAGRARGLGFDRPAGFRSARGPLLSSSQSASADLAEEVKVKAAVPSRAVHNVSESLASPEGTVKSFLDAAPRRSAACGTA